MCWEGYVCDHFKTLIFVCCSTATWATTRRLRRIYHHLWSVDALMHGTYQYYDWRYSPHNYAERNILIWPRCSVLLGPVCCDTTQAKGAFVGGLICTQTPWTGLRHPSFLGGRCRKAMLGVWIYPRTAYAAACAASWRNKNVNHPPKTFC